MKRMNCVGSKLVAIAMLTGVGYLAAGQALPCWKTTQDQPACQKWAAHNLPEDYCEGTFTATVNMMSYFAERAATGWTSQQSALFECSGSYYTGEECDVFHQLNWQWAGSQATGNQCPSGPPQ